MAEKGSKPLKILAIGDVRGRINDLQKRINTVHKKAGPFDLAVCVGAFFNEEPDGVVGTDLSVWTDIKTGKVSLPIPVYILGPLTRKQAENFPNINGCELAENLVYLGRGGCLKTNEGLTIAYLSGNSVSTKEETVRIDVDKQLKTLEARSGCGQPSFKGVDIFITSDWPAGITNNASDPQDFKVRDDQSARTLISHLTSKLRPRYHFAGLHDCFYERLPYRNHRVMAEPARHVTRFIGLADVGNIEKKKWIYAFNLVPLVQMNPSELNSQSANVTENPFKEKDLTLPKTGTSINTFFYSTDSIEDGGRKRRGGRVGDGEEKRQKCPPKPSGPCWFCLSGAEVEKHLVVSVGEHCYLAMAKGGMTANHVMVLPIAHHASTLELPDEVAEEMSKFKGSLKKCFKKSLGHVPVFFERNFKSQHLQLQAISVPKDMADSVGVTLQDCAEEQELELTEMPDHANITQMAEPGTPFFYAEVGKIRYFHRIRGKFPLQFGREVLGHENLLNLPDKIDWRGCKSDKESETQMTKNFRKLFQPFDFTLDDEEV